MFIKSIQYNLYISLAACLLASCNASNDTLMPNPDGTRAVTVNMKVGVSGGIASRELNVWDGAQQVNDMRLYVFRRDKNNTATGDEAYTYYIPDDLKATGNTYYSVTAFDNKQPYYPAKHNNNPEVHSFELTTPLPPGYYYQFLAIGRDDKYADNNGKVLDQPDFTQDITTLQDAKIGIKSTALPSTATATLKCTEFFSGHLQNEDTKVDTPILIEKGNECFNCILPATRNVAGLMVYVKNIPTLVEANTSAASTLFTPTKLSVVVTGIDTETLINSKVAPDGTIPLSYRTLGEIDLTAAKGWTIDATEQVFRRPEDTEKGWSEDSYMISNFLMPTPIESMGESKNVDKSEVTFMLRYSDGTHERFDNIKKSTGAGNKLKFAIEANHLYSLGGKSLKSDNPYDLKKHYEPIMVDMTIDIEPAFEKRHDFTTE